jgi:NAD(P)-dependent dehydrogenase (short-subunit alcohol dehydrogenase family)
LSNDTHSSQSPAHSGGDFTGQVAFVSGGGSGIGRATALAFAARGAAVSVTDIDKASAVETARLIQTAGGRASAVACDVAVEEDVQGALQHTIATFGRLDIAFNNAGIEQDQVALADLPTEDFRRLIDIDLTGVYLGMKHQIPLMREHGGVIVNTSSGAGVKGIPQQAAYAAAKWGVIGMTRSAALENIGDGIRINAVCPGVIDTSMMARTFGEGTEGREAATAQEPIGRPGRAEEIAAAVLWLCSAASAFTVGHALVVDGGQTI